MPQPTKTNTKQTIKEELTNINRKLTKIEERQAYHGHRIERINTKVENVNNLWNSLMATLCVIAGIATTALAQYGHYKFYISLGKDVLNYGTGMGLGVLYVLMISTAIGIPYLLYRGLKN